MKKPGLLVLCLLLLSAVCFSQVVTFNGQTFKIDTLYPLYDIPAHNKGLSFPWEITYGPDDSLWITEAHGYKIWKIHPGNKGNRVLLDLSGLMNFDYYSPPNGYPAPQGGLMGLAIHPNLFSGSPYVYVALVYYVYPTTGTPNNSACAGAGSITNQPCYYKTKILRYTYDLVNHSLGSPVIVMDGLSGSNDHNSGRLKISPVAESDGNYYLYYSIGDQGAGQFNNGYRTNNAQNTDIYEGKILRLNTVQDGDVDDGAYDQWIPNSNPFHNSSTGKVNAVWSFGHRNSQGLVWANVNGSWILYNSEHGDKSDDEVNIIQAGNNYGWPKVAGMCDNNYNDTDANPNNDYLANQLVHNETSFCTANNVVEPIFSFFNVSGPAVPSSSVSNYTWPTIAPSSIDYYDKMGIPGWNNSLLVTSLKLGMYRLQLKAAGDHIDSSSTPQITDTIPYLHDYRIRDIAIAPTGDTIFLAIDSSGSTSGPTGGFTGKQVATKTPGHILRMVFLETLLYQNNYVPEKPVNNVTATLVYPNPTSQVLHVLCRTGLHKPFQVQMFDMAGRLVLQQASDQDNFIIYVGGLRPGVYAFRLYNGYDTNVTTEKIVIR
ncbi:MAG TPA: PQQ-dependent sugar dehydrogenase [Puia sp.]|nr:PQQ-dependent sugar dehydrogenase [Puia sp.]